MQRYSHLLNSSTIQGLISQKSDFQGNINVLLKTSFFLENNLLHFFFFFFWSTDKITGQIHFQEHNKEMCLGSLK